MRSSAVATAPVAGTREVTERIPSAPSATSTATRTAPRGAGGRPVTRTRPRSVQPEVQAESPW